MLQFSTLRMVSGTKFGSVSREQTMNGYKTASSPISTYLHKHLLVLSIKIKTIIVLLIFNYYYYSKVFFPIIMIKIK